MLWFFLLIMLAAFGLFCCIYCTVGFFLSTDRCPLLICLLPPGHHPDGAVARYQILRDLGLVHGPLLIVGVEPEDMGADIEFCTVQELPARLELERNDLDRNGNGDPAGHHCRCGISQLR